MIDKKGKLFGKINIIDLAIVAIVIIAIFASYYRLNLSSHSDASYTDSKIEYVLKTKDPVRDFTVNSFEVGDKVCDRESGKYIGEIVKIEKTPAKDFIDMADGSIKIAEIPEKYDLFLTINSNAKITQEGYFAEGSKQITPFSTFNITTLKTDMLIEVVQINQIK